MATLTKIQQFIDEAKDAIDAACGLGLTPRQAVEALEDVIEYATERRAEYDDEVRARRARRRRSVARDNSGVTAAVKTGKDDRTGRSSSPDRRG
jgi:hypothetical protein